MLFGPIFRILVEVSFASRLLLFFIVNTILMSVNTPQKIKKNKKKLKKN
jgi:hypothetical protein